MSPSVTHEDNEDAVRDFVAVFLAVLGGDEDGATAVLAAYDDKSPLVTAGVAWLCVVLAGAGLNPLAWARERQTHLRANLA